MSTNDNAKENITRMLRPSLLELIQRLPSLDTFELELFEWYVKETNEVIDKMFADIVEDDGGIVVAEYFLKRVRYSHVIYLSSFVETFLREECERLSLAIGDSILFKLQELKGDNKFETKKKFLERYGRFMIPNNVWQDLSDLNVLRNIIVHSNGLVSKSDKDDLSRDDRDDQSRDDQSKYLNRLKKHTGIRLEDRQKNIEIIVESFYVMEVFASVKNLCAEISRGVEAAIQRTIRPERVK